MMEKLLKLLMLLSGTRTYSVQEISDHFEVTDLATENISFQFDRNYQSPGTKLVYYNNIGNKVNMCPLRITGTAEQLSFAWNVGAGYSTGVGFGALK